MHVKRIFVWGLYLFVVLMCIFSLGSASPNAHMVAVTIDLTSALAFKLIYETTAQTLFQCMEYCYSLNLCKTLSYWKRSKTCCLYYEDHIDATMLLQGETTLRRLKIPEIVQGKCANHTCAMKEMCVASSTGHECIKHPYSTVRCQIDWAQMNNICTKMTPYSFKTWSGAREACAQTNRSILAESHSYNRETFLIVYDEYACRECINATAVWIGLRYCEVQEEWVWEGSGKVLQSNDWTHWKPTQPILNGTNYCAAKELELPGYWVTLNCDIKTLYACQVNDPAFWTN